MAKLRSPSMRTGFLASLGTLFTSAALAFSQVPSGYYPAYPAAPNYGYYPSYAAPPGYGYGYGTGYPYAGNYGGYGYVNTVPATAQPVSIQSQPVPPGKSAPPAKETLKMPKETGPAAS